MSTQTKPKSRYNPCQIRRRVRHQMITADGVAVGLTKSFTTDDGTEYHPIVCLHSRRVDCQCAHFEFRLAKHSPTLDTANHWCKHIVREVGNLMRRGILEEFTLRVLPENSEAPPPAVDEIPPYVDGATGEVKDGWFQVVTPLWGLQKGQWVTEAIVDAAREALAHLVIDVGIDHLTGAAYDAADDLSDAAPEYDPECQPRQSQRQPERQPVPAFPDVDDELHDAPKFAPRIGYRSEARKPQRPVDIRPEYAAQVAAAPPADYLTMFDD